MDEPANVITLPANRQAQAKLAARGILLPYHDNPHPKAQAKLAARGILLPYHDNPHPNWNKTVRDALSIITKAANDQFGPQDSKEKDLFIRAEIEQLQAYLRTNIPSFDRIVKNAPNPPSQAAIG